MVALAHSTQTLQSPARLTLQVSQIGQDTTAIRCLDWDRPRFDIEFELDNGTTYNSFLIALDIETIATGHGPLLRHHIPQWTGAYQAWSQAKATETPLVAVIHVGGYGYSTYLANAIASGIFKTGVDVDLTDLGETDLHSLRDLVGNASGLVIGMPPQSDKVAQMLLRTVLAAVHGKQSIGLFETGGGEDEPVFPLRNRFQGIGLAEAFAPILVKAVPDSALNQICEEAGTDLGQWLTRDRTVRQIKAIDGNLERTLGRSSSGLYLLTVQQGNVSSAMLASWVTQASLEPLGVAIAVAKDRAITSFLQINDTFVLNVLEEDHYQPLMKHFLKRFAPGADRFAGIKTYPAGNGCPILAEALAYLECTVTQRLECSDHWILYATVQAGRVSKVEGFTAVHHRKVGTHY